MVVRPKFPVVISKESEHADRFKAATSIGSFAGSERSVRLDLRLIEGRYTTAVLGVRHLLATPAEDGQRDPRLYWLAGDAILSLLDCISDLGFYLHRQNYSLSRDVGVSQTTIKEMRAFRRRVASIAQVDPSVPWSKYRDDREPIEGDEE